VTAVAFLPLIETVIYNRLPQKFKYKNLIITKIFFVNFINYFFSEKNSNYFCYHPSFYAGAVFFNFKEVWFKDLKKYKFEQYEFYIPNDYDAYLKELYGATYMDLPNKKFQIPAHFKDLKINEEL